VAVAILCFAPALLASPGDDVKALLEQGKAATAYAEGKKYPDQLGNPAFDFFFGIAAIDAGHYGEGVLALERYLLNYPDNVSARLQLGRGYYLLGDDAQAHTELEALRKLDPPAPASAAPRAVASRDSSPARRRRAQVWPSPPVSDSGPV
jgi:Flp pilus assembly protein TadD